MTFEQKHFQAIIVSRKGVHTSAARALEKSPNWKTLETFEKTKDSLKEAIAEGKKYGLTDWNIRSILAK